MNIKKHLILFFVYTLIISPLCHPQRVEALESPQEIIFNRIANDLQQGHFKKEPRCESGLFLYTNTYSFEFPKSARSDWRNIVERASQKAKLWHTSGYFCRQSSIQDFSVEETSSSVSLHFTCFLYSENLDREVKEAQGVTEKVQALAQTAKKKTSSKREQLKYFHDAMKKSTTYRFDSGKRDNKGYKASNPAALFFGEGGNCYAYSLTTLRFTSLIGVPAEYVEGTTKGGKHAWNHVRLGKEVFSFDLSADVLHQSDYFFLLPLEKEAGFYSIDHISSFQ